VSCGKAILVRLSLIADATLSVTVPASSSSSSEKLLKADLATLFAVVEDDIG
jgi:hypothetical protein